MCELTDSKFRCDMCGGIFPSSKSDEIVAAEEFEENFGKKTEEWKTELATVCDGCFEKIDLKKHPEKVEAAKTDERRFFGG